MLRRGVFATWVLIGCGTSDGGANVDTEADTSSGTTLVGTDSEPAGSSADATSAGTSAAGSGDTAAAADTTTGAADGTGESDDTGGSAFVHEFHTELAADGRLGLRSNLPWAVDDCVALPETNAPCDDADADGLVDAWEDVVIDRLRPLRRFDEEESAIDDPTAVMADVGRVVPGPDGTTIRVYVMLGYSFDYGSCGFTSHNGDSERVALDLAPWPEGDVGGVVMAQAYTAAHEGTATDHGHVFAGAELDELVMGLDPSTTEPRWVVFPSADKHATYATIDICEGISFVPCFDEDCGPDGVPDPSPYDVLPVAANAGEPDAPRLTDLTAVGFPGDDAWARQDFCGGLGGTGCSSAVRDKLTIDPF